MKILIVAVLCKTTLAESQTMRRLTEALPQPLPEAQLPVPFLYRHAGVNLGPAGAYNAAAQYAADHGYTWLHLFDQDTPVTAELLETMLRHAATVDLVSAIAVIAPTVVVRDRVVSPRECIFNRHRSYPAGEIGIAPGEAVALGSACMIRVSALRKVGGFSTEFWLDYSDIELCHRLYLQGFKLWRAADAHVRYDRAMAEHDGSPERYRHSSAAESAFNDIYKGGLENAAQTLRSLARAVRQRFRYRNPAFSRIAFRQWIYRITTTRAQRIARWKQEAGTRSPGQDRPASAEVTACDAA